MKFEWDPIKEKINIQKHGITFEQASEDVGIGDTFLVKVEYLDELPKEEKLST